MRKLKNFMLYGFGPQVQETVHYIEQQLRPIIPYPTGRFFRGTILPGTSCPSPIGVVSPRTRFQSFSIQRVNASTCGKWVQKFVVTRCLGGPVSIFLAHGSIHL